MRWRRRRHRRHRRCGRPRQTSARERVIIINDYKLFPGIIYIMLNIFLASSPQCGLHCGPHMESPHGRYLNNVHVNIQIFKNKSRNILLSLVGSTSCAASHHDTLRIDQRHACFLPSFSKSMVYRGAVDDGRSIANYYSFLVCTPILPSPPSLSPHGLQLEYRSFVKWCRPVSLLTSDIHLIGGLKTLPQRQYVFDSDHVNRCSFFHVL